MVAASLGLAFLSNSRFPRIWMTLYSGCCSFSRLFGHCVVCWDAETLQTRTNMFQIRPDQTRPDQTRPDPSPYSSPSLRLYKKTIWQHLNCIIVVACQPIPGYSTSTNEPYQPAASVRAFLLQRSLASWKLSTSCYREALVPRNSSPPATEKLRLLGAPQLLLQKKASPPGGSSSPAIMSPTKGDREKKSNDLFNVPGEARGCSTNTFAFNSLIE